MARAARRVIENKEAVKKNCTNSHKKELFFVAAGAIFFHRPLSKTQDKWSNPAQSYIVLPNEKMNQINTKNYWK